ncbi:MAG: MocR-like pyridoxine biosynthesis transcription factor PdxR, partial [Trebonia sp.]
HRPPRPPPGPKLAPPPRPPDQLNSLAADLGIARNTVAEVYSQLVAEGWLTAQTGSGTSVAPRRAPHPGGPAPVRPDHAVPRYDLRAGVPDLSAFPRRAWLATARKVLAATPDHLLGYPDPRGVPQLRAALADYLARARGVTADPAHIVICAGFAHGLAGISRALRSAGASTLAVEAYGHRAHRDIAVAQGLRLRPLPVDPMGAVIGEADGADAILLTPAHQFPLGVTLHPRRRREAADWGGVVIEDDYDGEFRYDRQPVGALQTLAPDRVIYAGTASKSLAPALRLGWLVVPPRLLDAVTAELAAGPSAFDQLTLAEFITSGGYDRQIRRARLAYRRRRDRLAAALRRQGLQVTGIAAGLQAVLEFSRTELERAVVARASQHGVAVDGLERYRVGKGPSGGDGRAGLVIGYGRPPEHAFTTALARLCAALPGPSAARLLPVPYPGGHGEPGRPAARIEGVMTIEDIVIIGVAAICVFVAVLVFALRMSAQRQPGSQHPRGPYGPRMYRDRRLVATAAPPHGHAPERWEERAASFGPQEDEEYGGAPGYGRPSGYGPPPLWTEPPGWR